MDPGERCRICNKNHTEEDYCMGCSLFHAPKGARPSLTRGRDHFVQCDMCNSWWHMACCDAPTSKEILSRSTWICCNCTTRANNEKSIPPAAAAFTSRKCFEQLIILPFPFDVVSGLFYFSLLHFDFTVSFICDSFYSSLQLLATMMATTTIYLMMSKWNPSMQMQVLL